LSNEEFGQKQLDNLLKNSRIKTSNLNIQCSKLKFQTPNLFQQTRQKPKYKPSTGIVPIPYRISYFDYKTRKNKPTKVSKSTYFFQFQ